MDALYAAGIRFAELLQSGPPWLEKFWISVTSQADPKCVFTVCFPVAYFLSREVGMLVLWTGLVAEWLNVVFKWLLFGERPFWWLHRSGLASKELLTLRQFPVSCETGPGDIVHIGSILILAEPLQPSAGRAGAGLGTAGSPSGHCMITGAALWPLVTELTALASRRARSPVLKLIPFGAYILLLVAVGLSRVFVLAHFPHQVVSGILTGAALGRWLQTHSPTSRPPGFFVAAALGLLLSSLSLHRLLLAAGIDVDWSIALASTWCSEAAWLRLDTRPFASICRDSGSALGLALATAFAVPRGQRLSPRQRLAGAVLALAAVQGLHRLPQPGSLALWYGTKFLQYATGPWLVASLLPWLILSVTHPRGSPHSE